MMLELVISCRSLLIWLGFAGRATLRLQTKSSLTKQTFSMVRLPKADMLVSHTGAEDIALDAFC